jgi:hypothetical protein
VLEVGHPRRVATPVRGARGGGEGDDVGDAVRDGGGDGRGRYKGARGEVEGGGDELDGGEGLGEAEQMDRVRAREDVGVEGLAPRSLRQPLPDVVVSKKETNPWSEDVHAQRSSPVPLRRRTWNPLVRTSRSGRSLPSTSMNETEAPRSGASSLPASGAWRCFSRRRCPVDEEKRRRVAPPGPERAATTAWCLESVRESVCGEGGKVPFLCRWKEMTWSGPPAKAYLHAMNLR